MITLYQFPKFFNLPNLSPFCVKVECFFRMTKLKYIVEPVTDTRTAPKGKCPYISDDGKIIADSELILDYLEKKEGIILDVDLNHEQQSVSRAIQAMLDERLYWSVVYSRWHDQNTWPQVNQLFFGHLGFPLNKIIPVVARKQILKQMHGHGMGRHNEQEIYAIGQADIAAIANSLADKQFIHGDQPSRIDACVFSYIINLIAPPFSSPLTEEVKTHKNLTAYNERMVKRYFPELEAPE